MSKVFKLQFCVSAEKGAILTCNVFDGDRYEEIDVSEYSIGDLGNHLDGFLDDLIHQVKLVYKGVNDE